MEIRITTEQVLKILNILSWIIFIGVCIEAGAIILVTLYVLIINPDATHSFWNGNGLLGIYQYDHGYFLVFTLLLGIVAVMKALIFYLIVKILHDKKLNMAKPFNKEVGRFIFNLCYLAFGIGMFSYWGGKYIAWLIKQGVDVAEVQLLRFAGADVWLFMGVVLFVIAQIFKRGIEIQTENELTI
jgi:hypothetical protein